MRLLMIFVADIVTYDPETSEMELQRRTPKFEIDVDAILSRSIAEQEKLLDKIGELLRPRVEQDDKINILQFYLAPKVFIVPLWEKFEFQPDFLLSPRFIYMEDFGEDFLYLLLQTKTHRIYNCCQ